MLICLLITCGIELDFSQSNNFATSELSRTPEVAVNPPKPVGVATEATKSTFQKTSAKLYVPVVT